MRDGQGGHQRASKQQRSHHAQREQADDDIADQRGKQPEGRHDDGVGLGEIK